MSKALGKCYKMNNQYKVQEVGSCLVCMKNRKVNLAVIKELRRDQSRSLTLKL